MSYVRQIFFPDGIFDCTPNSSICDMLFGVFKMAEYDFRMCFASANGKHANATKHLFFAQ